MSSRVFRRRSATAAWIYVAVAFGIAGTIVAARVLGLERVRRLRDRARRRRLLPGAARPHRRGVADEVRLPLRRGRGLGPAAPALPADARAQARRRSARDRASSSRSRRSPTRSSARTASEPALLAAALLPLVQSPENVGATALLLHSRYDLRGAYQAGSGALRLIAIAIGAPVRRRRRRSSRSSSRSASRRSSSRSSGSSRCGRFPHAPAATARRGRSRASARSSSSRASRPGVISLRTTLVPLLLGVVAGPTQVGLFRIAQTPQTGLAAASSPARLVLLTEQTRDWEGGRAYERARRASAATRVGAAALMVVAVPVFFIAMPWLVEVVFGDEYDGRRRRPRGSSCSRPRSSSRSAGRSRCRSRSAGRGCGSSRTGSRRSSRSRSSSCSAPSGARPARRSRCSPRRVVFAAAWLVVLARLRAEVGTRPDASRRVTLAVVRVARRLAASGRPTGRPGEPCAGARGLPRGARPHGRGRDDRGCASRRRARVPGPLGVARSLAGDALRALRAARPRSRARGADVVYATSMIRRAAIGAALARRPLVVKLVSDEVFERRDAQRALRRARSTSSSACGGARTRVPPCDAERGAAARAPRLLPERVPARRRARLGARPGAAVRCFRTPRPTCRRCPRATSFVRSSDLERADARVRRPARTAEGARGRARGARRGPRRRRSSSPATGRSGCARAAGARARARRARLGSSGAFPRDGCSALPRRRRRRAPVGLGELPAHGRRGARRRHAR